MPHNLFIAYDLNQPGQNYDAVRASIHQLGKYAQLQDSLFYVHSLFDFKQAHDRIRLAMDENDKLAVIEAERAFITEFPKGVIDAINGVWHQP